MGKKLQRRFPSHKRASISVLNQAVVQSPGDDFERTTHLNVCVLRCLFKYLRKKKPRGLQLLLTGSCWWSGESSGVINSKQRITENSGCLTSDVWYNIWKAYISYCVFAFLIMFCFSQYENELTSWEYKPVNGWVSLLGSFLGVWSNGENLKGFNVFYRQLAWHVIHLGIMECWLQSDSLVAQELNLLSHPYPCPVSVFPLLLPDSSWILNTGGCQAGSFASVARGLIYILILTILPSEFQ